MTNRDYLMKSSNEELSELIWSRNKICDSMHCDCNDNCLKCIEKWLGMERKPDVKKWQIRRSDTGRYYLVLYVKNDTECLISTENGVLVRALIRDVSTWDVVENTDVDKFLERVFENL